MAQLDPTREKIFKEKVDTYLHARKALNPAKAELRLSDFAVLKLPLRGKSHHGEKEIRKFWTRAKNQGLIKVEFNLDKIKVRIRPADFLLRVGDCYYRFDMIAEVHGLCDLTFKVGGKLTDPPVPFDMTFAHQWECPLWPLEMSLGV